MIEVCKGTNLSVFLQRIKQKEEMENKKPIVLNNLEEWDFTDYIDSLIQTGSCRFGIQDCQRWSSQQFMGHLFFFCQYRWRSYYTWCERV